MVSIASPLGPTFRSERPSTPRGLLLAVALRQRRAVLRETVAGVAFLAGSLAGIVGFLLV